VLPVVVHEQSNPTSRHSNLYILEIGTLLQRISYNSNEIILYEKISMLGLSALKNFSNLCLCFSNPSPCNNIWKWLSSISLTFELMNRHSRINDNNKKDRTKATAAIPMVGAIVTAALLLSGLSLIGSYQPATAQQNMTGGGTEGGATTAGNVTNATTAGNVTNATTAGNVTNATTAGNVTNATNMTTTGTEGGEGTTEGGTTGGGTEGGGGGNILEDIFGGGGGTEGGGGGGGG
jgi:hypothetical protein